MIKMDQTLGLLWQTLKNGDFGQHHMDVGQNGRPRGPQMLV
jgi:hypothetical protein